MRVVLFFVLYLMAGCQPQASTLPDFTQLVEDNAPAVVNISTEQKVKSARPQIPEMFRRFFDGMEDQLPMPESEGESLGSGFLISADGFILTNHHVVADASRIIVRLQDGSEKEATLVGSDPRSDLALLQIDGKDLPSVKIGSSKNLKVGEWVLAIGAPFGFESTVTAGIVSAKGRSLPSENYVPFIQTDVAINPGNSGGPLFNLEGEVIGINSQIVSRNGGFMGLSFAIPIDMAMEVVAQLKDKGRVSRGWLGVLIQPVDRELAQSFGLEKPAGALVSQVMAGSPAEKAGFQVGDVVVEFNGQEIGHSGQLPQVVGLLAPGTRAEAVVVRDGKRKTLKVTVEELPEDLAGQPASNPKAPGASTLGLSVEAMSEEQLTALGLEHGVQVVEVAEGAALKAGIRRGDVLVSLNNQPLKNPQALASVVADLPEGAVVPVLLHRDGSPRFLALRLD
ncbi:DegQ family serine endoprotease [Alcanivorax sp. 1008]|uniref:DegQ family serine endoprotease n=1 Tax=Alcanivorax sp. 1008 TaxID=2816853 RepID=UPI001DB25A08|nr:DegQ family serine endoprotease [Alcanivorax sp. 1008]MCC1495604.1 DegQ family serine endoprotease [Alcanivorax sp. 1008]